LYYPNHSPLPIVPPRIIAGQNQFCSKTLKPNLKLHHKRYYPKVVEDFVEEEKRMAVNMKVVKITGRLFIIICHQQQ